MTTPDQFKKLIQKIASGSRLLRSWDLTGGISAQMTAFEFERPNGQISKMIVRRPGAAAFEHNPHAAQAEFELLQQTQSFGLATPTPYYLDQSNTVLPASYIVIEYIEGVPEFAPANIADFTHQIATQLAKIHRVDGSSLPFLPQHVQGCAEIIGVRPTSVDASLEEGRIRDALEALWPLPQRNISALLHGDFWPGNMLWQNDTLVAVIDWEDAQVGDPLIDFAISRLDMLWIFGIDAFHSFTDHYRSLMSIDYTDLPYWDLCAALRLVRLAGADLAGWAAFFGPFGRHDITEQTIREHYRFFVTQAFEKLEVE